MVIQPFLTRLIERNFCFDFCERRRTTVSITSPLGRWAAQKITSLQMLLSGRGQKSTKNGPDLDSLPAVFSSHLIVISSAARQFFSAETWRSDSFLVWYLKANFVNIKGSFG